MIKRVLIIIFLNLNIIFFYASEKNYFDFKSLKKENINFISSFQFNNTSKISLQNDKEGGKEKKPIFDKPDFSWFKEKNRLDKLFIAIGAITCTAGTGILLAGLINLLVNFDAVSIGGEPIMNSYIVYYTLIGVGGGLIAAGIPFIIVGSVRLGRAEKKEIKAEVSLNNYRIY